MLPSSIPGAALVRSVSTHQSGVVTSNHWRICLITLVLGSASLAWIAGRTPLPEEFQSHRADSHCPS
jgi:hypothetical protein